MNVGADTALPTPQSLWAKLPEWARRVVDDVAREYGVTRADIMGHHRVRVYGPPRHETWLRIMRLKPDWSSRRIGRMFGRDGSTLRHAKRERALET